MDLSDLYQEVILDHNKNPRNFGELEGARSVEGYNPLCGDKLTVYLQLTDDVVTDVRFRGTGCAISQASASVMTTVLKGKTVQEAEALFAIFQRAVTGRASTDDIEALGEMAALTGVSEFPSRIKCATLGWHTALSALHDEPSDPVSTE